MSSEIRDLVSFTERRAASYAQKVCEETKRYCEREMRDGAKPTASSVDFAALKSIEEDMNAACKDKDMVRFAELAQKWCEAYKELFHEHTEQRRAA